MGEGGCKRGAEPDREEETGIKEETVGKKRGGGCGARIYSCRTDMASVCDTTDCNRINEGKVQRWRTKRRKEEKGKEVPQIGSAVNLHQVRYSLGTCYPSQTRGPVEGRLITMAAGGGGGEAAGGLEVQGELEGKG